MEVAQSACGRKCPFRVRVKVIVKVRVRARVRVRIRVKFRIKARVIGLDREAVHGWAKKVKTKR